MDAWSTPELFQADIEMMAKNGVKFKVGADTSFHPIPYYERMLCGKKIRVGQAETWFGLWRYTLPSGAVIMR